MNIEIRNANGEFIYGKYDVETVEIATPATEVNATPGCKHLFTDLDRRGILVPPEWSVTVFNL